MKVALLYRPPADHLQRLRAIAPNAEFVTGSSDLAAAKAAVGGASVIMGNWHFEQALAEDDQAALVFVQSNSVGMDRHTRALRRPQTVLCNARGLYDDEIADHTLALTLSCVRRLHRFRDDQQARLWRRDRLRRLGELNALVVGLGGIGTGVARRLAAFGCVIRVARRRYELGGEGFALVGDWREALATTDLLLVTLPLTPETRGMIGPSELRALRRGAILVNTSRGALIDEQALLSALRDEHLGAAGLDAFAEEPLPATAALWAEPNCVITPHVARSDDGDAPRWLTLFEENFARFVQGRPLCNVVDRAAGY